MADVRALLDARAVPSSPIDLGEVIDTLTTWIAGLFEGMNRLGEDAADASAVRAHVEVLVALRARVAANPRRRPWLALWGPVAAPDHRAREARSG